MNARQRFQMNESYKNLSECAKSGDLFAGLLSQSKNSGKKFEIDFIMYLMNFEFIMSVMPFDKFSVKFGV